MEASAYLGWHRGRSGVQDWAFWNVKRKDPEILRSHVDLHVGANEGQVAPEGDGLLFENIQRIVLLARNLLKLQLLFLRGRARLMNMCLDRSQKPPVSMFAAWSCKHDDHILADRKALLCC